MADNTETEQSNIWFSERETEDTTLTRDELVDEIRRVTDLDAPAKDKILEIRYLIKHYFTTDHTD